MRFFQRFLVLVAIALVSTSAVAQTTASLSGRATLDGNPLPGVTVTISSPNMIGTRLDVTDVNGVYTFNAIPPGDYTVRFDMEGMNSVTKPTRIGLGQTGRADADLKLSQVAESITVTASSPAVIETTEVASNIDKETVEELPIPRTLQAITGLQPGVVANTGTGGAISIAGAFAYDSLYLVNGAVTNENLRGQTHSLFIEDAIQETTVMTGAISAEYGRFTGGVVSAITKSGGNEFSGSLRDSLTNPAWTLERENEPERLDKVNSVYEGTLGGFIIRDRLWFFGAGRDSSIATANQTITGASSFNTGVEEFRLEGKLTGQIFKQHTITASYLDIDLTNTDFDPFGSYELSSLDVSRELPNSFVTAQYSGVWTPNFLLEAGYSKKKFAFVGSGGDFSDFAHGSWGADLTEGGYFGAPIFCGFCDPETRDNENYNVKATYYLATKALGTHNIATGYDNFAQTRFSNNFQSGSNFGIYMNLSGDHPVAETIGSDGLVRPTIAPGDALILYNPILLGSQTSELRTNSLYVNDKWDLSNRWSFNLGFRYDKNDGADSAGHTTANDSRFSPRLGANFDFFGDGRLRFNGSYSRYVSQIQETIGGSGASAAGNPAYVFYIYDGPTISGLPTVDAFARVNTWFQSVGGVNGATDYIVGASFPGFDITIPNGVQSPYVDEWTGGIGGRIGTNGYLRADVVHRSWADFYIRRLDTTTGKFDDPLGFGIQTDASVLENDSGDLERTYNALIVQGQYRVGQRFNVGGNYTWSTSKGNDNGETGPNGPVPNTYLLYPEFKNFAQHNPNGYLLNDQRHKLRGWVSYDLPTPVGNFNFTVLERFDSASPYSALLTIPTSLEACLDLAGSATAAATCRGLGLPTLAQYHYLSGSSATQTVNYYASDRGEFRWDDLTATDLAINYTLPVWRVNVFAQGEVINVFNENAQINGRTGVSVPRFNPFTGAPNAAALDTALHGANRTFGTARNAADFQQARTYRISLGLRF